MNSVNRVYFVRHKHIGFFTDLITTIKNNKYDVAIHWSLYIPHRGRFQWKVQMLFIWIIYRSVIELFSNIVYQCNKSNPLENTFEMPLKIYFIVNTIINVTKSNLNQAKYCTLIILNNLQFVYFRYVNTFIVRNVERRRELLEASIIYAPYFNNYYHLQILQNYVLYPCNIQIKRLLHYWWTLLCM